MPDGDSEINPATDTAKCDPGLTLAYRAWQTSDDPDPEARVALILIYTGDLSGVESAGFETQVALFDDQAMGIVRFADIPTLVAHEGVVWLAGGGPTVPTLMASARDIRARASSPSLGDGVWFMENDGKLDHLMPNGSGAGVIIALIDSGVDFSHPVFHRTQTALTPKTPGSVTTRILRIWDQGLPPASHTECPDKMLLMSTETYGVEYKQTAINAALDGSGPMLLHRDDSGHGTLCAAAALGGAALATVQTANYVPKYVGIAPESELIMVKYSDVPVPVHYMLSTDKPGAIVQDEIRFRDAVLYCLRVAKAEGNGKPVVIVPGFEYPSLPGDGMDPNAQWIDNTISPTQSVITDGFGRTYTFPTGAAVVRGVGNDHNASRIAEITMPDTGTITVPVTFDDPRPSKAALVNGAGVTFNPLIGMYIWYGTQPGGAGFNVRPPQSGGFLTGVPEGQRHDYTLSPTPGVSWTFVGSPAASWDLSMDHKLPLKSPDPRRAGGVADRQLFALTIAPKNIAGAVAYITGIYEVQIYGLKGSVFYLACGFVHWGGLTVGFRLSPTMRDGAPRHANIRLADDSGLGRSTILDSGGRNTISVAAYDVAQNGAIASFSSRGPLRDFTQPPGGPIAPKPDIAAPGFGIWSADSIFVPSVPVTPGYYQGDRFRAFNGTSLSGPIVAGVVALLLEKQPGLNVNGIRSKLAAGARAAVSPGSAPGSVNAYGAGRVDALSSFTAP
jgi:subtilase family protein